MMPETWTISVGGRSYGPYALEQMKAFQSEGRLAPHSLVARDGAQQFQHADDDATLARLFAVAPIEPQSPAQQDEVKPGSQKFGRDGGGTGERNRYIIASDMKSGSIAALEEEIFNFGSACGVMPQVWVLVSEVSLNTIRGELIQKLGKLDTLFMIDTTHDKAAWFNFGPEADAKVRRLWQRDMAAARSSA
jgi:hypothetical protein